MITNSTRSSNSNTELKYYENSKKASFDRVRIRLASPETIRQWSHGEVKSPETINYRSFKPEKNGLFCEKIFGPVHDYECSCGKYRRTAKPKGDAKMVCDHCGVEITQSKVRRERMGHIELAVPVSHVWFFKCMPSRLAILTGIPPKNLERVLYYEDWVVTDAGDTVLKVGETLNDDAYNYALRDYGNSFKAGMGAAAIYDILKKIDDLKAKEEELRAGLIETQKKTQRKNLSRQLRAIQGLISSNSRPEWMILEVLPVIPPDLRPLVALEGGRFATSDLNDLYRRVINRNNRLNNLLTLRTPEIMIRHEKRMLQESVDALMDNGKHGRVITGAGGRELKSLADMLKGKQGRFRQNLLGKRVDYSGRSVIVVGPELRLNQCGLPKKMALALFEPFVIHILKKTGAAPTTRSAKKLIERADPVVWDALEKAIKGHPVMLNRAPTLHRLSIQAFDPVLIEGSAIRLHPLVCTAFNADFDGDQMAVHVPLSPAAQMECKLLMLSTNNILSPANGKPIMVPTQDVTLGTYYLTAEPRNPQKAYRIFNTIDEVLFALELGYIKIHDAIRIPNPDYGIDTVYGDKDAKYLTTSAGRCIFNELWQEENSSFYSYNSRMATSETDNEDAAEKDKPKLKFGFYNKTAKKKTLGALIADAYQCIGHQKTVELLDRLKALGYKWATLSGFSISVADMIIPKRKKDIIDESRAEIAKIETQLSEGAITKHERSNKVVDTWTRTRELVADALVEDLEEKSKDEINPVFAMLDSGARGSRDQISQLGGMRGLMAKPNGDIIERPILSNFREGLTVQEFFISSHGARKGLADTALKTADSGYMTRKLVDVSQDIICRKDDCGTTKGVYVSAIVEGDSTLLKLKDRLIGRFSAQDIRDPMNVKEFIIKAGEEFTPEKAELIEQRGITRVLIRSVLTCNVPHGVCVKCYGKNLATDKLAEIGDALGIIAAQSIGEPGTQLTMRTFHIGGTATSKFSKPEIRAREDGTVLYENVRMVEIPSAKGKKKDIVAVNKNGYVVIYDQKKADELEIQARKNVQEEAAILGIDINRCNKDYDFRKDAIKEAEIDRQPIEIGAILTKRNGEKIKQGELLASWDSSNMPIISEKEGVVYFEDLLANITLHSEQIAGHEERTVMPHRDDLHPQIIIKNLEDGEVIAYYPLPVGAYLMCKEGDIAKPGMILARTPRQQIKNKDITGGLPRVSELFDARTPSDIAEIAKIDGRVEFGKMQRSKRTIYVVDVDDSSHKEEHAIPTGKTLIVADGDFVKKGQKLTNGAVVPEALLKVCGINELQRFLVNEVQTVYRSQGVEINDKHIEVIIRQMLLRVTVTDPGSTCFLEDEIVDKFAFDEENRKVIANGGVPAKADPKLQGVTKVSLSSDSFLSAASFQDTTRILADAALTGRIDYLKGFKENVITGHLIPAGTGESRYQKLQPEKHGEELDYEKPYVEEDDAYNSDEFEKLDSEDEYSLEEEENVFDKSFGVDGQYESGSEDGGDSSGSSED